MKYYDINKGKKAQTHKDVAEKLLKCGKENDCAKCEGISDCIHYIMRALSVFFEFFEDIDIDTIKKPDKTPNFYS